MSDSLFTRHFVWRCTPESIEAGKVSLLACGEVVFSVAAYFWLTWYFDTYAFLVTSAIAAPFVLLRSDASVALGVKWFRSYWYDPSYWIKSPVIVYFGIATIVAISGIGLANFFFENGYWTSVLVWVPVVLVCVFAFAALATAWRLQVLDEVPTWVIGPGLILQGFGFGIFIRALCIRLVASLFCLFSCIHSMPRNWWTGLFLIDCYSAPQLIPGAQTEDGFPTFDRSIKYVAKDMFNSGNFILVPMTAILFAPAILYRYSI